MEIQKGDKKEMYDCTHNPKTNKRFNETIRGDFMNRLDFDSKKRELNIRKAFDRCQSTCTFKPDINYKIQEFNKKVLKVKKSIEISGGLKPYSSTNNLHINSQYNSSNPTKKNPTVLTDQVDMYPRQSNYASFTNSIAEGATMKHKHLMQSTIHNQSNTSLPKDQSYKRFRKMKTEGNDN